MFDKLYFYPLVLWFHVSNRKTFIIIQNKCTSKVILLIGSEENVSKFYFFCIRWGLPIHTKLDRCLLFVTRCQVLPRQLMSATLSLRTREEHSIAMVRRQCITSHLCPKVAVSVFSETIFKSIHPNQFNMNVCWTQ